ncbi:SCO1860 family LAETG-anchored protein [Kitasatospora sp. NPDC090091]|uniref:SCO1860 family LAETG-anchored protein n=1 Tax=Kitasatospora sp. NPDC090091 TaxID=3364081 RepID=UPI0037F6D47B
MSSSVRSAAAVAAATAAVSALIAVPSAHAAGPSQAPAAPAAAPAAQGGKARAVTAELDLDVSLLNKTVDVPVNIALNKVETPAQRSGAAQPETGGGAVLTAKVDGVDQQGPVTLVKADVGRSVVKADAAGASASVKLVNADVHAPGLPATTLLGLESLSASATCPVDGQPAADVVAPARLTVLGKPVTLSLYGPTKVDVPLVGGVSVEFSKRTTTSTTAAASALEVQIEVNPLNLNVAKVTGKITVASVSCEKPTGPASPTTAPTPSAAGTAPATGAPAVQPAVDTTAGPTTPAARTATGSPSGGGSLAATGGSAAAVPLAAGAAGLVVAGGLALRATRRRAGHARRH